MSQNSLSVSEVGKSSALLQAGAGNSQSSEETSESQGFLSVLGAIFSSEATSDDKVESDSDKASESELEASQKATLIKMEGEEELAKTGGKEESTDDASEGEEKDVKLTSSVPQQSDSETKEIKELKTSNEKDVDATMNEGSELLKKLDESNQVLQKKEPGNELPPDIDKRSQNVQQADRPAVESDDLLSRYVKVEGSQSSELSDNQRKMVKDVSANLQAASEQGKPIVEGKNVEEKALAEQINRKVVSVNKQEDDASEAVIGAAIATGTVVNSKSSDNLIASQNSNSVESVNWDTAKTASAVGVGAVLGSGVQDKQVMNTPTEFAANNLINQKDVTEMTEEELQSLAQINWGNSAPESAKVAVDSVKVGGSAAAAHTLNQQQLHQAQQLHQTQQLQAQAQVHSVADKAVQQAVSPELTAASLQGANSAQFVAQQMQTQQPANKAALAASAAALGTAGVIAAKGKDKDKDLSHQLAGVAGQQGAQQVQTRSEMQQAVQQSPLQLAKETAGDQLAERVQMMMSKNLKNIDIRLDPPELGRMQIRMSMNGDMASVQFTVSNPQARDMVEQAMPRLREMLSQQGVQLADSSVHQQSSGQQQREYATSGEGSGSGNGNGSVGEDELNLDESITLDANIATKDDGISYYA